MSIAVENRLHERWNGRTSVRGEAISRSSLQQLPSGSGSFPGSAIVNSTARFFVARPQSSKAITKGMTLAIHQGQQGPGPGKWKLLYLNEINSNVVREVDPWLMTSVSRVGNSVGDQQPKWTAVVQSGVVASSDICTQRHDP